MMTSSLRVAPALRSGSYIVPLNHAALLDLVGGKAHNLYRVSKLGVRVPGGFVVTTRAFDAHLQENDLAVRINAFSSQSAPGRNRQLSADIHALIINTTLSPELRD